MDLLIGHGADVNKSDIKAQTPLFVAIKKHHAGCVWRLLEAGANPEGDSQNLCTPIYVASMEGFYEGLKVSTTNNSDLVCKHDQYPSFIRKKRMEQINL